MDTELPIPSRTFILGLADLNGHISAEPLYEAAKAAGFTTTKLRLAIGRLVEADQLSVEGRGRQASIQLTDAGMAQRAPDLAWLAAAYRSDAGLDPWDHQWHVAAFEIPEADRQARDALRNQITELLGAPLASGLYVSPHQWEPWILHVAHSHGVQHRITLIETSSLHHDDTNNPAHIAAKLWPINQLDDDYRAFIDTWTPALANIPADPAGAIRAAYDASNSIEQLLARDPLLPHELVPKDFAAPAARALFIELHQALATHDILANAGHFTAYHAAIDHALKLNPNEFWTHAFTNTTNPTTLK